MLFSDKKRPKKNQDSGMFSKNYQQFINKILWPVFATRRSQKSP